MEIFAWLLFIFLISFLVKQEIDKKREAKNTIMVYISDTETKFIPKKEYYKYEKIDKKIRKKHEEYNKWFNSLDADRMATYFKERRGFYYELGYRRSYIWEYIKGEIDKNEFDKKFKEESETDEFKKRYKECVKYHKSLHKNDEEDSITF